MARSAVECQRNAVSFVTRLCVGALVLIAAVNGRCTTDCPCVLSPGNSTCCLTVSENQPPGTVIGNANDLPLVANAMPTQYFLEGDDNLASRLFRVNVTTGTITTAMSIDRENFSTGADPPVQGDCVAFSLSARLSDDSPINSGGTPILFGIVILDENDNRPQFNVNHLNITVDENNHPGVFDLCRTNQIDTLQVTDNDTGTNAEVTYKVAEGTPGSELFNVTTPSRPCVTNLVAMDRENTSVSYSFVLVAMDGGNPSLTSNITVEFNLIDINDNFPMFLNDSRPIDVLENTTIGDIVGRFQAIDIDEDMEPLTYGLMTTTNTFQIDPTTGNLLLTDTLDAESLERMFDLTITVVDSNPEHISRLNVVINVIDVNERTEVTPFGVVPDELVEEKINTISESAVHIFILSVDDRDKSDENRINEIKFVTGGEYFEATNVLTNPELFRIIQMREIDRENVTNGVFQLSLLVVQRGNPEIKVPFEHNFTILDINDNAPYLISKRIEILETDGNIQNPREEVIPLNNYVRDDDNGENGTIASFILISVLGGERGNFTEDFITSNALEGNSREILQGQLHLPSMLDRENYGNVLTVTMTFRDGGAPPMSRTDSFTIEILDVNDNAPVFDQLEYTFTPSENRNPNEIINMVQATDMDDSSTGNGRVVYTLEKIGDYKYFSVGRHDGAISSNNTFDREQNDTFVIYVSARDEGNPPRMANASAKVTILIRDENDEPPRFTSDSFVFIVETTANTGDFVGRVVAVDEDLDTASNPVFYKFLYPTPDFRIVNSSGRIELDRVLSITNAPYNLTVVAFNPGAEEMGDTAFVEVDLVQSAPIEIYAISASAAGFLVLAIFLLSCCICCLCHKSKTTGKYDTNPHLNNTKPILKTLPATNGQQRSVKFNTTIEETHYDPTGIAEDSTIRKESNFGSGDESPQTSLRITMPNGMNGVHESEGIMEYEMSPSIIGNGDLPHQRPSYSRHGRIPSPILLQEELNTSEYSQSTLSAIDDRNTYNSEGEEVDSTYSDAPSNYNTSIPRFGRQTIQVEDHRHPGSVGHYGGHPPSHQSLDLHSHLPPVQHSSPGHFVELRAHNLARHEAQFASSSHPPPQGVGGVPPADDIRELSLGSLPRNIGQHHHHGSIGSSHGSSPPQRHIQRPMPPASIHQPPPVSMTHSIVTPTNNSHANTRNYPHPLVMPEAFPSAHSRVPSHRFDSFIPSFTDYGETSTYASTELNEALEFKYDAEPDFCSLTATDYGENDTEL